MKIRLNNIKWDNEDNSRDDLPKSVVKKITIRDFNNCGLNYDNYHQLSIGELSGMSYRMMEILFEEYDVKPIDGSFEYHWDFNEELINNIH